MRRYVIRPGDGIEGLRIEEADRPSPGPGQVLVAMRATSLNSRDLMIVEGAYAAGGTTSLVPLSDGAGEVVAVGERVSRLKVGDRVAGIFMQSWTGGAMLDADADTALGGAIDGVLAEYRLFDEDGLVVVPEHLSFEQAATLPCAAVTAWNALYGLSPLVAGQTVLTLGTGGVSVFAIQFANLGGARVIATSSSDEKLQRARGLGAAATVNYKSVPEWGSQVRALTDGRGVDKVVEVGGPGTLAQSIAATARGGTVEMIGVLTMAQIDPLPILTGGVIVRGLMVGSREMFEGMNRAISAHRVEPVIDRIFEFDKTREAFRHLKSAQHFGKIVIRVG